jgi:hypothetical protein
LLGCGSPRVAHLLRFQQKVGPLFSPAVIPSETTRVFLPRRSLARRVVQRGLCAPYASSGSRDLSSSLGGRTFTSDIQAPSKQNSPNSLLLFRRPGVHSRRNAALQTKTPQTISFPGDFNRLGRALRSIANPKTCPQTTRTGRPSTLSDSLSRPAQLAAPVPTSKVSVIESA